MLIMIYELIIPISQVNHGFLKIALRKGKFSYRGEVYERGKLINLLNFVGSDLFFEKSGILRESGKDETKNLERRKRVYTILELVPLFVSILIVPIAFYFVFFNRT